ncbi:type I-E CRISPR-associated protein Cse2/CasB [Luethyella okanaganae]|uniref:Type I-E CRISPR-associated protein Cse2/CasB n=1 Tax=Luethyella okanaganae TaxID=69372 RepID=A0ABW1VGS2_9MICO
MTSEHRETLYPDVGTHVGTIIRRLQSGYVDRDASSDVARLALLRRGVGKAPGDDVRLIEYTTAGLYPDDLRLPDAPTDAERAVYAALTLFAVHQQSQREGRMHRTGYSFGRSARLLAKHTSEEAVRRRFTALATASGWDELTRHARGLVQQFRAHSVPLDYERFARDLLHLQQPRFAAAVRNSWGRDFYRLRWVEDDADDTSLQDSDGDAVLSPTN